MFFSVLKGLFIAVVKEFKVYNDDYKRSSFRIILSFTKLRWKL